MVLRVSARSGGCQVREIVEFRSQRDSVVSGIGGVSAPRPPGPSRPPGPPETEAQVARIVPDLVLRAPPWARSQSLRVEPGGRGPYRPDALLELRAPAGEAMVVVVEPGRPSPHANYPWLGNRRVSSSACPRCLNSRLTMSCSRALVDPALRRRPPPTQKGPPR